mmetsp:Transcript_60731/g.83370  ORF Transcript_60731/g.83370 Transcript_60731/m.83370 type:complete len:216 (-) Transcript_60731:1491-2138(-)
MVLRCYQSRVFPKAAFKFFSRSNLYFSSSSSSRRAHGIRDAVFFDFFFLSRSSSSSSSSFLRSSSSSAASSSSLRLLSYSSSPMPLTNPPSPVKYSSGVWPSENLLLDPSSLYELSCGVWLPKSGNPGTLSGVAPGSSQLFSAAAASLLARSAALAGCSLRTFPSGFTHISLSSSASFSSSTPSPPCCPARCSFCIGPTRGAIRDSIFWVSLIKF